MGDSNEITLTAEEEAQIIADAEAWRDDPNAELGPALNVSISPDLRMLFMIHLPDDLLDRYEALAEERGSDIISLLEEAAAAFVAEHTPARQIAEDAAPYDVDTSAE